MNLCNRLFCQSACLSVCPSICPSSITLFLPRAYHRIFMELKQDFFLMKCLRQVRLQGKLWRSSSHRSFDGCPWLSLASCLFAGSKVAKSKVQMPRSHWSFAVLVVSAVDLGWLRAAAAVSSLGLLDSIYIYIYIYAVYETICPHRIQIV